ncbi:MAG: 50S ribosomal protein L24 [Rickettsiales bacterium]|nr:50S ribosomal protein L24 [Rickettsiales bacterium]|tara:strand:+ start:301 stop:627 length:327 start_codon:yes stop_codon:yes gene_type:complete
MSEKIKKGDNVIVLSGKDKGKNGKVLKVVRSKSDSRLKAVVEGVNIVKKHKKQSATNKGGIESVEMPVFICKLSILDPKTSKPSRVGFKKLEDGKKVRFAKKSGETLD